MWCLCDLNTYVLFCGDIVTRDNGLVDTAAIYVVLLMDWCSFLMYYPQWVRFKQFSDHVLTYPRQIWLVHFAGKGIQMFINDNGLILFWYPFTGLLLAQWTRIDQWSMW